MILFDYSVWFFGWFVFKVTLRHSEVLPETLEHTLHISVSESLWLAVEWIRGYLIIMTNMHGRGFRQQQQ